MNTRTPAPPSPPRRTALVLLALLAGLGAVLAIVAGRAWPDAGTPAPSIAAPASGPTGPGPSDRACTGGEVGPGARAAGCPQGLPANARPASPAAASAGAGATAASGSATRASGPTIGSEGFGPHIDRAALGHDPQAAWQALQWIQGCGSIQEVIAGMQVARDQGAAPGVMTPLLEARQLEARRCQTVTAQQRALAPALAWQAYQGRIPGAAAAYAGTPQAQAASAEDHAALLSAIRQDALKGEPGTLIGAIADGDLWGLGVVERLAFMTVWTRLSMPGGAGAEDWARHMIAHSDLKDHPPTADDVQQARQLADHIWAMMRASGTAPGPRPPG